MRLIILLILISSCDMSSKKTQAISKVKTDLDIQGHRGCRGLMPENSLPAFEKALKLKVTTLEMDLIISQDHQVVVSHEPFFRAGIALTPQGDTISEDTEREHNMYEMDYDQIKTYEIGTQPDKNHPNRNNVATYKPRFAEVVDMTKTFCDLNSQDLPFFNIEIKSNEKYDDIFHPEIETFVDLVIQEVDRLDIAAKTIIQSFDLRALRITKEKAPQLTTALLIENLRSAEENINELGFNPDIYSCYYKLVNEELLQYCQSRDIKVIPWTVNTEEDMKTMIELGVDGIISDYPDLLQITYDSYATH